MADGLSIFEIEKYTKEIIPKIESELASQEKTHQEQLELFSLYKEVLKLVSPYDFPSFNKYLEFDEDKRMDNRGFYHHRKDCMEEVVNAFNDMEIYDKYDLLLISLPPRTGKSTFGIRFLAWICGKYPEETQLATSYSDSITTSFYIGVMEIVSSQQFLDIFPESCLVNQNAKREEIWLKCMRRYPTITFVPIGGSMTGRAECKRYLYCDDMVSGLEEALSVPRLEKLWGLYSVNCRQRKLDGCKEIHIATPWSVHDIISRLKEDNKDNPRCKIINIPCYDETGESNFKFKGGFSTKYYNDIEKGMDVPSFNAIYKGAPIEREGLLYHEEDLMYYMELPNEKPDTTVAICDSKNLGVDNVASIVGKIYGDFVYIDDITYNDGLPEVTRPLVANMWIKNNVVRADVELNNGGNYYAEDLDELVKNGGGKTSIRIFFSGNNKKVKIITYSDYVTKTFIFKHPSTYSPHSEYARFMNDLLRWTQTGNNKHDDAPDAIAMLAQLVQDLQGTSIKILDRRKLSL